MTRSDQAIKVTKSQYAKRCVDVSQYLVYCQRTFQQPVE